MIKRIVQNLLLKSGKTYTIDPKIPNQLFYNMLINRVVMVIRGFFKTGKKVFIGRNTRILNNKNIVYGKSVTIGSYCEIDGYYGDGSTYLFGNAWIKIDGKYTIDKTKEFYIFI